MIKKVFHLNCATLKPIVGSIICHCILLETDKGLILIDTGLGLEDIKHPKQRLDFQFRAVVKPVLNEKETAFRQIEQLGFKPEEVKYIILTHLHEDHVGGIDDFPNATVITAKEEYDFVFNSGKKGSGYNRKQLAGKHSWVLLEPKAFEWHGFHACKVFEDSEDLFLVDLKGHTAGQSGVVMKMNGRTLFFCADAYYHRRTLMEGPAKTPFSYKMLQFFVTYSQKDREATEKKIVRLFQSNAELELFCAHDINEFNALKKR